MSLRMNAAKFFQVLALLLSPLIVASAAQAQGLPKYEVTGFRDATFGMVEKDVRAAVVKSFGVKDADIKSTMNPIEGTALLTVHIPSLEPAPGPADVTYIFGSKSKKLIQVNVIWGENGTTASSATDATALIGAGQRLQRYFAGYTWKKDAMKAGIPVGDNTVVMFASEDDKTGAVRVILDGIQYQVTSEGNKQTTSPNPKTPAKLLLSYIANRENPDVATIQKGQF